MRFVLALTLVIAFNVLARAQDGSNIRYVKVDDLTERDIGTILQIDFYKSSKFRSRADVGRGRSGDAVNLKIAEKDIVFVEHRNDDGYNNWIKEQYLESRDGKIRIREFKLLKLNEKTISLQGYFNVEPFEQLFIIAKSDIAEILKKSED